jgi:hypothetical protein
MLIRFVTEWGLPFTLQGASTPVSTPAPGELVHAGDDVMALFRHDGKWYDGRVRSIERYA